MKDSFINAKLVSMDTIKMIIFSTLPKEDVSFYLLKGKDERLPLEVVKYTSMNYMSHIEFKVEGGIQFGYTYYVVASNFGLVPLYMNDAVFFDNFDDNFYYDGDDLGYIYNKDFTTFKVWAPIASSVELKLFQDDEKSFVIYPMTREENGVYCVKVQSDLVNQKYTYLVTNSNITVETTDPYGKGSTTNGKQSVIINFDALKIEMNDDKLPTFRSYSDAIIYEGHVRDLTIDPNTTIVHKGTFKGLTQKGATTKTGYPVGRDYINSLGITHLQLLPIYDYKTVDEDNPSSGYNWGYDPDQYFCVEGSYASNLQDPISRITDLIELVSEYHSDGIRIVMDVVYNHVYESDYVSLNKVVPNYFFRRRENGKTTNVSGCGNDFASERKMAAKLIIDACKFWAKQYHLDGFRFDLMGMIHINVINQVYLECKKINPYFIIYGEGWNMSGDIEPHLLANHDDAMQMPNIAFFNDMFRDTIKGPTYGNDTVTPGYGTGKPSLYQDCKFLMAGSSFDLIKRKKFLSFNQSINYVECHDNGTLFDKINGVHKNLDLNTKLEYVKLSNAIVMMALGIPFFHMGQEVGLSKNGEDNTYNKGDKFNMMNYSLVEERKEMVNYFKCLTALRKEFTEALSLDLNDYEQMMDMEDLGDGGIVIKLHLSKNNREIKEVVIFINPSDNTSYYSLDDYYHHYFSNTGCVYEAQSLIKNAMLTARSLNVFIKKSTDRK